MIPCEIDISSTPFGYSTGTEYEIELTPEENKTGFNFIYDDDFRIPYIIDTVTILQEGRQLTTQAKKIYGPSIATEKIPSLT